MALNGMECKYVDWIHLATHMDEWLNLVNTVPNYRVPQNVRFSAPQDSQV